MIKNNSVFCLQKLVDQSSDDFVKVLHTVIRGINDHKKYYEKVSLKTQH